MTIDIPEGYESLGFALGEAVAQAARGKGADRHAEKGEQFADQLIMSIPKRLGEGGECFCLGQAAKKIFESRRLAPAPARAELLGAVNYIAAAWSLLGGGKSVLRTEPRKAPENVCLGFAERVVALMKEMGVREVSFAGPGACIRADGTVTGLRFATEDFQSGPDVSDAPQTKEELVERIRSCNPSVYADPSVVPLGKNPPYAPEDADPPSYAKGEPVEYRLPDGTWAPANFVCMDGGYAVLECGGPRFSVLAFEVRPAEEA